MSRGLYRVLIAALLACQACSAAPAPQQKAEESIRLGVKAEDSREAGPVAILTLENGGRGGVAVTRTFGLRDVFFQVEIEDAGGTLRRYPAGSQYELFGDPGYTCLGAGKNLSLRIPLNRWFHVIGGRERPDQAVPSAPPPYSFALTPGQYRIRARYLSYDDGRRAGCPVLRGPIVSDWVPFAVVSETTR